MPAKNQNRRRLTDQELENIKKELLERKRQLWDEINDDIDEDVRRPFIHDGKVVDVKTGFFSSSCKS